MASHRRRHDQAISRGIPSMDNLNISLELFNKPGWNQVESLPQEAARCMQKGYDKAVARYAKEILSMVRKSILRGRPPMGYWEPLSPKYKQRWAGEYPEHHLMYLTGQYLRSIGHFTRGKRSYIGVVRGEKRSGPHPENNLTMNQVAIIQEFGTANGRIPARPLWSSALQKLEGSRFPLKDQIIQEIRHQLIIRDII